MDDEDQFEQDDQDEQYLNEPYEPVDDVDHDDELYLRGYRTNQGFHASSKQPKKISKEDIFTTKDPKIRKQALYKGVLSIPWLQLQVANGFEEYKVQPSREFKKGRVC